jgi:RNA polymerase sigma-70 factor (family 1)
MEQNVYNEEEILTMLAGGDRLAFEQVYNRYFVIVTRLGYQYLKRTELVEDLVQEVFSTVWDLRADFTRVQNFEAYFFTMSRNLALAHFRKLVREESLRKEVDSQRQITENNIESYLTVKEFEELINQAVEELPAPHKRVFQMGKVEGMTHKAIALQMDVSQQTVKNYMVLALKALKHRLRHHITTSVGMMIAMICGLLR